MKLQLELSNFTWKYSRLTGYVESGIGTCPVCAGGLNGSTQHSSRTRLALKTKAKSLARVRSAGTLPWLGFDRGQPNRSLLSGKHCRINALDGVASTGWAGTTNRELAPVPKCFTVLRRFLLSTDCGGDHSGDSNWHLGP